MALGFVPAGISLGGRILGGIGSAIGRGTTAVGRGIGGLLGKTGSLAKRGALPAAGAAGIYGINKNLEELGDDMYATSGGGGGGLFGGGGGGSGGGASTVNAAAATSVLSDADSSDPVVRQLQDIERVLQSIKGDTATLVTGVAKMGSANNGNAARAMFGNNRDKPVGDLKSLAAAVAAALFAQGAKTDEQAADSNADGIPDNQQDVGQVAVDRELQDLAMKPKTYQAAAKVATTTIKAGATGIDLGKRAVGAVQDSMEKRAAKAGADAIPKPTQPPGPKLATVNGKPVPTAIPEAANDPVSPKPKTPDVDAPKSTGKKAAELAMVIPKYVTGVAAKAVPMLGAFVGAGFAIEKLFKGDFRGAGLELGSVLLPGPSGTPVDLISAARDVYMDVHDGRDPTTLEEMNSEGYQERWNEVLDAVQEYAGNLFKKANDIPSVEARPVKQMGRSGALKNKDLAERQAAWDEKYGDMYNTDGTMKPEVQAEMLEQEGSDDFVGPPRPVAINEETSFLDRMMNRGQREYDKMAEVAEGFKEGFDKAVPFQMTADTVEISTDSAISADREAQANRIGTEVGGMVAQQRQGGREVPVGQPVQVSVASPKNSMPNDNASTMMMYKNGRHLTGP